MEGCNLDTQAGLATRKAQVFCDRKSSEIVDHSYICLNVSLALSKTL